MHDTQIQEVSEQFYDAIALDDLSGEDEDSENEEEQSLLKKSKVTSDFKLYIVLKGVAHEFCFASCFLVVNASSLNFRREVHLGLLDWVCQARDHQVSYMYFGCSLCSSLCIYSPLVDFFRPSREQ